MQHFHAEGCLRCLEGVIIKGWKDKYFLLDGYQLHEMDGPERRTARRVVDLRGAVARVTQESEESRKQDASDRVFQFKVRLNFAPYCVTTLKPISLVSYIHV